MVELVLPHELFEIDRCIVRPAETQIGDRANCDKRVNGNRHQSISANESKRVKKSASLFGFTHG